MNAAFESNRRIRLGIWGLGRGLDVVRAASVVNIDVVAGCDFNPHFRKAFQEALPEGQFTDDDEEFLGWDFDAVVVATFCPAHAEHAIRALQAGKHVLSEVTAFHTPAEGVRLAEEVARSGRVYQLAENYPYTPFNRYLADQWRQGLFGELQYAEYSYVHDCLHLAYTYIDGAPIEPGYAVHSWRSWLPWHYYCTHSLGPVMAITGTRPVRVVSLPGRQRLAGHIGSQSAGLKGMAPSLIEMDNGGLVRNLMGGCADDANFQTLRGTRGGSEIVDGQLSLRLGGRGHSPRLNLRPPRGRLDAIAAATGPGAGDFWTLYHFANEILNGVPGPFDVYRAADATLPGILAHRSARQGGEPQDVPNFRIKSHRDAWRGDDGRPDAYDTEGGPFPASADTRKTSRFCPLMKESLGLADRWQAFHDWRKVFEACGDRPRVIRMGEALREELPRLRKVLPEARALVDAYPMADGARALREVLDRIDARQALREGYAEELDALLDELRRRDEALSVGPDLEGLSPQLLMRRPHMDGLPEFSLPEGHAIRPFQPGDERHWRAIVGAAFRETKTEEDFRKSMVERPDGDTANILFVVDPGGTPCATASAYGDATTGYVHFVATLPSHAGRKLGYWVSLEVLRRFRRRGCRKAFLKTDDFRIPAIKTYRQLGFKPWLAHESHLPRWKRLARLLDAPDLLEDVSVKPD